MKMTVCSGRLAFVLWGLSLSHLSFGRENIVGGSVVKKGDPIAEFTVRVYVPGAVCTGTLITRNVVVTAAHCVIDDATLKIFPYASDINVIFDRFESEDELRLHGASAIIPAAKVIIDRGFIGDDGRRTNQDYGLFSRKNHDVALIRLSQDAPADFAPLPLARKSELTAYASTAVVAGYGREAYADGARMGRLKVAEVRITENGAYYARVAAAWGDGNHWKGDSGGPLLIKTPREGYKLAGVINTGVEKYRSGFAARIEDYSDFLSQAMPRLGSSATGLFTLTAPAKPGSSWPSF